MSLPSLDMDHTMDEMTFDSFCIVCDRLITPPKPVESEVKMVKKKSAGGTIRVSFLLLQTFFTCILTHNLGEKP